MKKAMLTTIMAIAVTGLLALGASPAMADVIYFGSSPDEGLNIDSERMQDLMGAVNAAALEDDGVVEPGDEGYPDDGGSSGYSPSDEAENPGAGYPDDGGSEGYVPPGDEEYPDDGGSEGYHNPRTDNPPTTTTPPETTKTPPQSSSKLPNTGTQMAIFAAIGLVVIATAYAVRRATGRRTS